jgi:hypothetical protein
LWVPGGTGDNQQTVETGWQVYPQIYGDNQPHLFIYFTTHHYNSSYPGCYNLDCQGFVQTSSNVVIGGPISPVSTVGGNQYDIKLMFLRDAGGSHDWWLKVNDVWIGYYPNSLFNSQGIANYSNVIDYGGEVVNFATGGLHTTTQMGSGRFPKEGWQYAAFIRSLKYLDLNNYLQDSIPLTKNTHDTNDVDNSNYYDLSLYSSTDPNWLQYFYFGGPGRQLPNLAPYQSPGWSDKIVVSKTTGTNTDSSPLYMTDTLYVDWAVINNGSGATSARFYSVLYVDGVFRQQLYVDPPLNPTDWRYVFDYSIGSLSVGTHTIKIVVDSTNAVDESNETDNEYTKTITIASPGTIYIDTVQKIFIGYYQRSADPSGLIFWAAKLEAKAGNLNEIIAAFANSAESQALYGTIKSSNISTVVNSIYNALFCRSAEAAGLNYYVNGFNSGQFTAATIMLNILNGAQGEDLAIINNKLTAANLFTKTIDPELDGRDFQATYSGNADAQKARDFLSTVCWNTVTIPTQAETRAYIQKYIADPGDPILR